jgi:hypothetical protein
MTDMNDKNSGHGAASERAHACGTPFSFYQLHKWSTL